VKKLLIVGLICAFALGSMAQADGELKRRTSITGAVDTTTFSNVKSRIKSFEVTAIKDSGTVGGKIYLEGTITPDGWVKLDSLTLANVATAQSKVTVLTATSYKSYRYVYVPSGTSNLSIQYGYLRRQDE
jgi:hypothetical protein